jgi:uncharacterized membrane protein YkgB
MVTTPGIGEPTAGGFPVLSANGEFLMKDIALVGLALWLLVDSISATQQRQAPSARLLAHDDGGRPFER